VLICETAAAELINALKVFAKAGWRVKEALSISFDFTTVANQQMNRG